MKTILKMILISAIIIIIFILFSAQISIAKLDIGYDHKPVVCFEGCHDTGGFNYGATDVDNCGDCHNYKLPDGGINVPLMEEGHNPGICKVCHNIKDSGSYHILHENVNGSCTTCHGDNGKKPSKPWNECNGCHGGKIHTIHQNNISQLCVTCHETRPALSPASSSGSSDVTTGIYAAVINYKQFTLYEVFKRILSSSNI